ncbi:MAG: class IV adenylate cyclase [Candidatus Delongbacteria bacterium]|nr:class IV adenylate cyclase [Candidatus Delongbacteria bacterium]
MANKLEIEKKYYIKDGNIESLKKALMSAGAKYIGDSKQTDIYFNVPGRDSFISKECLRIRESETKKEITYKAPTKNSDINNGFFAKEEVNLAIQDIEKAKILLLDIGCTVMAEVKKERKRFRLDKFKIFIDNVPNVGLFIEIEIMDFSNNVESGISEIDALMNTLNIGDCIVENKPYRDLVMEKGGENGRKHQSNKRRL